MVLNLLIRLRTGTMANVFVLSPHSRCLLGDPFGWCRCGCRVGSRHLAALLGFETSFDMWYLQRAEHRMWDIFTAAGSAGRSHFGGRLSRGTRIRRPCGSMWENMKVRWAVVFAATAEPLVYRHKRKIQTSSPEVS